MGYYKIPIHGRRESQVVENDMKELLHICQLIELGKLLSSTSSPQ